MGRPAIAFFASPMIGQTSSANRPARPASFFYGFAELFASSIVWHMGFSRYTSLACIHGRQRDRGMPGSGVDTMTACHIARFNTSR